MCSVMTSFHASLVVACIVAVSFVGCASPPPGSRDAGASGPSAGPGPRFAAGGPDAHEYGADAGYPIGDQSTYFSVPFLGGLAESSRSGVRGPDRAPGVHAVAARPRGRRARIRYEHQGQTFTLDDYLARNPATGLLIARDDTIFVERYQYARTDRDRFTSWSMAKTVTAMLIGIAIAEGRIRSVDDRAAAYVPALAGTEYGRTSLRHLLQMSSGVRFSEEYTGARRVSRLAPTRSCSSGPAASRR